jgi:hypothetical protein
MVVSMMSALTSEGYFGGLGEDMSKKSRRVCEYKEAVFSYPSTHLSIIRVQLFASTAHHTRPFVKQLKLYPIHSSPTMSQARFNGEPVSSQYIPLSGLTHGDASAFNFYDGFIPDFEFMFNLVFRPHFTSNNDPSDADNCVNFIHDAIVQVSGETGVRDVYLMAVISQESDGNCRALVS